MRPLKVAARLVVLGLCAAALSQAQTVVRSPYLQNMRTDRVSILWTMLQSGTGAVQYSTDRSFSRSVTARIREFPPPETGLVFPFYQYQADLTNLSPGAEYSYRVTLNGETLLFGEEFRFRTAALGSSFTFLAFGDSGTGSNEQTRLADRMTTRENPALVLHVGDIAYPSGTFQDFQSFYFDVYRDLMTRVPFFAVPGNHEYWRNGTPTLESSNAAPFVAVHAPPTESVPAADRGRYFSFDWGNVHFIALDSNIPLQNVANGTGGMAQWLESDLQKTRRFWKVAYFHHPPYATGPNERDPLSALARDFLVPILERYDVQLVLNAHEHSYQRSFPLRGGVAMEPGAGTAGTLYLTTGGGGAALYQFSRNNVVAFGASVHHYTRGEVQGGRMTLRAIRTDGTEIESVTLQPTPFLSGSGTVNAASFLPLLAPGALISIFGRNLATEEAFATRLPLPAELNGTSVMVNGRSLPLLYVSPYQINAQMLFDVRGQVSLRVTSANGSMDTTVMVADAAPGIFSATTDAGIYGTVVHADGTLVSAASPARAGEFVSVYLTGLGQVNGEIAAGQAAPASPLLQARTTVDVLVAGTTVRPSYAGLTPGFAGLYQVNLQIPAGLASGSQTLRIVAGGSSSNPVTVEVR